MMISKEIDFENIEWKQTPYKGIFVSPIDKEDDPSNSKIPKLTAHAVRIDPECEIGLHYHDREDDWTEFIILPKGGNVEVADTVNQEFFSGPKPVYVRVNSRETYRIKNRDSRKPVFLISIMKPGFTEYEEIKNNL